MEESALLYAFLLPSSAGYELDAMPHLIGAGEAPKEGPIRAGEYLEQRLKEIGLA